MLQFKKRIELIISIIIAIIIGIVLFGLFVRFIQNKSCYLEVSNNKTKVENKKDTNLSALGARKILKPTINKKYLGAFPDLGGMENIVTKDRILAFEDLIGRQIAWVYFSNNWFDGIKFPTKEVYTIKELGLVPFIRIMPRSIDESYKKDPKYSLQDIIDGKLDKDLEAWALSAKEYGEPLLIDFAVEPNGNWFSWSGVFNGGNTTDKYGDPNYPDGPERYKDAYKHIINIFRKNNVNNVTWFFHPDIESSPYKDWNKPKMYYPGDDYIDWIGVSIYGALDYDDDWILFSNKLKKLHKDILEISSQKPIALLEFGVMDNYPKASKPAWLQDACSTIKNNKYIKFDAVSYWHENWQNSEDKWIKLRLDSSEESLKVAKDCFNDPIFINNLVFSGTN